MSVYLIVFHRTANVSCENFLFHMSVDVSHQKDCHDVINTIHYVSEPLNKFTERLSAQRLSNCPRSL